MNAAQQAGMRSVNWRIFASTLTVSGFTSLVKLAGGLKVMATARYLGTSDALDAFLIAFVLPSFVAEIAAGSLIPSLIPALIRAQHQGPGDAARRLYSSALAGSVTLLGILACGLALASGFLLPLLGSGFDAKKLELTRALFLGLLPWLPASGLIVTWRAILNTHEQFALAAAAPAATPIVTILLLYARYATWGVSTLVMGTVAGVVIEAGILAWSVRRLGYGILPRWGGWNPELRDACAQYAPMVAGTLILSGSALVDQGMAAALGGGSVSALTYGTKLTAVLLAVGAMPLATAMLPHLSRMIAAGDRAGVRHTLATYGWLIAGISAPLAALLMLFSAPLVRLFFERGAFTGDATRAVAAVQTFSLIQLPFAVLLALMLKLVASLRQNRLLVRVAGAALVVNVFSDWILMRWLGVPGIALSGAVVQLVSLVYLAHLLWRAPGRAMP